MSSDLAYFGLGNALISGPINGSPSKALTALDTSLGVKTSGIGPQFYTFEPAIIGAIVRTQQSNMECDPLGPNSRLNECQVNAMRNISAKILLAIAAVLTGSAAQAQVSILAKVMGDSKLSATEAAAAIVIADALGMKVDAFIRISNSKSAPCSDVGVAMVISNHSGRSLDYVLGHRPKGEGWGNVAKRMGMHPGDFNKRRVKGHSFDSMIWINLLSERYKVREDDYDKCRKRGLSDLEIVLVYVKSDGKREGFDRAIKEVIADRKGHDKDDDERDNDDQGRGRGKGKGKGG